MNLKNIKKILAFALLTLTVTSCVGQVKNDNFHLADTDNYSNRALDESIEMTALSSLGNQKLLVVPVVFTNHEDKATPEMHEAITKSFFGAAEDTGWESVASFYQKSSYDKLTLSGEVMPYFHTGMSTNQLNAKLVDETQKYGPGHYWDQSHYVIEQIYNTYDVDKLKEYDLDGDGHVDALWMVYIAPTNVAGEDSSLFWAYKFYWNQFANKAKPTPNVYAWAGIDFMRDADGYSYDKPDAHTYIHETGHLLSLPDYYDYDRASSGMAKTNPSGGIDMMANNIIDHNMYSKYRYNWSKPYIVTGDADITIRPAESSGDFIIIKDGWNGHAYDEYVLIEFYTPTGLNAQDSEGKGYGYDNNHIKGYDINGVRIWHVDSRLRHMDYSSGKEVPTWTNEFIQSEDSYTTIGPSNTGSRSSHKDYKLLHLLNATGKGGNAGNWLRTSASAGNTALFQTGDLIEADGWKKYFQTGEKFNDGTEVGYSIEIGEMTDEGVELLIRKAVV